MEKEWRKKSKERKSEIHEVGYKTTNGISAASYIFDVRLRTSRHTSPYTQSNLDLPANQPRPESSPAKRASSEHARTQGKQISLVKIVTRFS